MGAKAFTGQDVFFCLDIYAKELAPSALKIIISCIIYCKKAGFCCRKRNK